MCLLTAYSIGNISTRKISKSIPIYQSYSNPKMERFLRHVVVQYIGRRTLFMVALWNRADHYIFMLWFLSSSSMFYFFLA